MDENCNKVFDLYKDMLMLHLATKTSADDIHEDSGEFYNTLFSAFHDIKEAMMDSGTIDPREGDGAKKEALDILEEAKSIVEGLVDSNDDVAIDNVLRSTVERIGTDIGHAKSLIGDGGEEPEKKEDEPKDTTDYDEGEDESSETEVVGYTVSRKSNSDEKMDNRGGFKGGPVKKKKKMKYPKEDDMMY